ncbi:3723_t:CDS:2 [Funneliformis geosporum]|uniref:5065_t:CDS:1 n=1 Tax=Funneliformis geosporum TaxID=1117311 RepID=A0A9W4X5Q4_9GLOM|nr:3722_t:CDS:2 [Funneliformis geosporum]CAI2172739.1 3723_t:CDS:2 [Funneliformis geosporum]CAI2188443.1 5065_t:CDS:2 [Funneliformis geosporum]
MVLKARAIFDCKADDELELSFKTKEIIVDIIKASDEGWFEGTIEGSKSRGLFPENYVEFFEEENQPKLPPKPPPRKTTVVSKDSNGVKTNSTHSFIKDDPVDNSDTNETSLTEPKKLSAAKFAIFEQLNKSDNVKTSQKSPPPIIKPKVSPVNSEISSSRSIGSNSDGHEREVTIHTISVDKIKSVLESNVKEPGSLPLQSQLKPIPPIKPKITPPPIAPKPGKLVPPLPSRSSNTVLTIDKKPPLPPRKSSISSISSVPSNNETPPPTPPRPSLNVSVSNSFLTKQVDKTTSKARTGTQDVAGEAAKQGVSIGVAKLKDDLKRSKYGNKKIPGQNALFDKLEKNAQDLASNQAKKKAGDTFDKNLNEIQSKPKPNLPIRNSLSNINNQITSAPRPLLSTRNPDVIIPRRPKSHDNSSSENDLSKGIPPDAMNRYEIIYDANKDDDDFIDGAVVKAIYLRSCLDNKTLSKIWDLLDTDEDGRLSRNEFCAGMFLIDERLKGQPIPDKLPYGLLELTT